MSHSSENTEGGPDEIIVSSDQPNRETEEDSIFQDAAILFRFSSELNEWVGRGTGILKVLKHKQNGTYRILMRQNQTYRVCANHQVPYLGALLPKSGSNREFIWTAFDFADEPEIRELFAVRFSLPNIANAFRLAYEEAREANRAKQQGK